METSFPRGFSRSICLQPATSTFNVIPSRSSQKDSTGIIFASETVSFTFPETPWKMVFVCAAGLSSPANGPKDGAWWTLMNEVGRFFVIKLGESEHFVLLEPHLFGRDRLWIETAPSQRSLGFAAGPWRSMGLNLGYPNRPQCSMFSNSILEFLGHFRNIPHVWTNPYNHWEELAPQDVYIFHKRQLKEDFGHLYAKLGFTIQAAL